MIVSIIAAVSENSVIGNHNKLPWHLSGDMKYFKETTTGHPVIMGRKTYQSLGKPLKNRKNIVITSNDSLSVPGYRELIIAPSLQNALEKCAGEEEVFIIGGESVFKEGLVFAQKLYLTKVRAHVGGDAFFPPFSGTQWKIVKEEAHPADDKNQFPYTFYIYNRM